MVGGEPDNQGTGAASGQDDQDDSATVRVDRWLWAARLFKTRSLAGKACTAGHVQCNGTSVKAAKQIRAGDRLEALTPGGPRVVDVLKLAEKRGSATVAQTLYLDQTPVVPKEERDPAARDRGAGRPTKRDRRLLVQFRRRHSGR